MALIEQLRADARFDHLPVVLISAAARPHDALPEVRFVPNLFDVDRLMQCVAADLAAEEQPA